MFIQIAIDGHSGVGKSTLAKTLSKKFNILHINTGLIFRGLAWYLLKHSNDVDQELINISKYKTFIFKENQWFFNNTKVPERELYTKTITDKSSEIAKLASIRNYVLNIERSIADTNHVIMDGRDVGSTVFPNALVKIFLIADINVRAKRRFIELQEKQLLNGRNLDDILKELISRDKNDEEREISPLIKPQDAICIDGNKPFEEVLHESTQIIQTKLSEKKILLNS